MHEPQETRIDYLKTISVLMTASASEDKFATVTDDGLPPTLKHRLGDISAEAYPYRHA
ncbi:hypothetical protein DESC_660084 [Desulfosarcina cetonica]|nr:hypothetical protein DESC_660084 [Desulfosarcina cetonica]